jgi:hypothetical protein
MQLQGVAVYGGAGSGLAPGFAFIADGLAVVEAAGVVRLYLCARSDSRVYSMTLATDAPSTVPQIVGPTIGTGSGANFAVQSTTAGARLYVFTDYDSPLRLAAVSDAGLPGLTTGAMTDQGYLYGVTAMEILEFGDIDVAAIVRRGVSGVQLFTITDYGVIALAQEVQDRSKSYLADISDLAQIDIGRRMFLLTASAFENGVTVHEITSSGRSRFVDAIGRENGLPVSGPVALQTARVDGTDFVILASTLSSSLTVLRVNERGVLFVEDHLADDRSTRIDAITAMDQFSYSGRDFIVAGGSDAGISVFELLPDGALSHIWSLALESGQGLGSVAGIKAVVIGTTAAFVLTEAKGDRVHHLTLSLADLGTRIAAEGGMATGTVLDDRIFGTAGADTLQGDAGRDFLHDGGGSDQLLGGSGADVFVFSRDGRDDMIADFQDGLDRIDLTDWGRIYSASALTITPTNTGATVSYGGERLTIMASGALTLTDADFVF